MLVGGNNLPNFLSMEKISSDGSKYTFSAVSLTTPSDRFLRMTKETQKWLRR